MLLLIIRPISLLQEKTEGRCLTKKCIAFTGKDTQVVPDDGNFIYDELEHSKYCRASAVFTRETFSQKKSSQS
jgi:PhoPQ-activated pathogenicity-related protein